MQNQPVHGAAQGEQQPMGRPHQILDAANLSLIHKKPAAGAAQGFREVGTRLEGADATQTPTLIPNQPAPGAAQDGRLTHGAPTSNFRRRQAFLSYADRAPRGGPGISRIQSVG